MRPKRLQYRRRQAFTLIELLVVIGIIVLLAGLAIPAVVRSYRSARRTRTAADLALIGTALEAYKSDFGDYPRFDSDNTADSINLQEDRGARLLCRALLAAGPASGSSGFKGSNLGGSGQAPDGADGVGFRTRPGGAGTVYGPYVQNDKFKLGNPGAPNGLLGDPSRPGTWDTTTFTDATFLDSWGDPILYYPATAGQVTISGTSTATAAYVCSQTNGKPPLSTTLAVPLYNAFDNEGYGETPNPPTSPYFLDSAQLQYLLGDRKMVGYLDPSATPAEVAVTTQPYLLWSAGPDGHYGFGTDANGNPIVPTTPPAPTMRTDDITNFDLPADLRAK